MYDTSLILAGTKQKKQFLKWLHELTGDNSRGLESTVLPESDANTDVEVYEVIDVISDLKGGEMTLMNGRLPYGFSGGLYFDPLDACLGCLFQHIPFAPTFAFYTAVHFSPSDRIEPLPHR